MNYIKWNIKSRRKSAYKSVKARAYRTEVIDKFVSLLSKGLQPGWASSCITSSSPVRTEYIDAAFSHRAACSNYLDKIDEVRFSKV